MAVDLGWNEMGIYALPSTGRPLCSGESRAKDTAHSVVARRQRYWPSTGRRKMYTRL